MENLLKQLTFGQYFLDNQQDQKELLQILQQNQIDKAMYYIQMKIHQNNQGEEHPLTEQDKALLQQISVEINREVQQNDDDMIEFSDQGDVSDQLIEISDVGSEEGNPQTVRNFYNSQPKQCLDNLNNTKQQDLSQQQPQQFNIKLQDQQQQQQFIKKNQYFNQTQNQYPVEDGGDNVNEYSMNEENVFTQQSSIRNEINIHINTVPQFNFNVKKLQNKEEEEQENFNQFYNMGVEDSESEDEQMKRKKKKSAQQQEDIEDEEQEIQKIIQEKGDKQVDDNLEQHFKEMEKEKDNNNNLLMDNDDDGNNNNDKDNIKMFQQQENKQQQLINFEDEQEQQKQKKVSEQIIDENQYEHFILKVFLGYKELQTFAQNTEKPLQIHLKFQEDSDFKKYNLTMLPECGYIAGAVIQLKFSKFFQPVKYYFSGQEPGFLSKEKTTQEKEVIPRTIDQLQYDMDQQNKVVYLFEAAQNFKGNFLGLGQDESKYPEDIFIRYLYNYPDTSEFFNFLRLELYMEKSGYSMEEYRLQLLNNLQMFRDKNFIGKLGIFLQYIRNLNKMELNQFKTIQQDHLDYTDILQNLLESNLLKYSKQAVSNQRRVQQVWIGVQLFLYIIPQQYKIFNLVFINFKCLFYRHQSNDMVLSNLDALQNIQQLEQLLVLIKDFNIIYTLQSKHEVNWLVNYVYNQAINILLQGDMQKQREDIQRFLLNFMELFFKDQKIIHKSKNYMIRSIFQIIEHRDKDMEIWLPIIDTLFKKYCFDDDYKDTIVNEFYNIVKSQRIDQDDFQQRSVQTSKYYNDGLDRKMIEIMQKRPQLIGLDLITDLSQSLISEYFMSSLHKIDIPKDMVPNEKRCIQFMTFKVDKVIGRRYNQGPYNKLYDILTQLIESLNLINFYYPWFSKDRKQKVKLAMINLFVNKLRNFQLNDLQQTIKLYNSIFEAIQEKSQLKQNQQLQQQQNNTQEFTVGIFDALGHYFIEKQLRFIDNNDLDYLQVAFELSSREQNQDIFVDFMEQYLDKLKQYPIYYILNEPQIFQLVELALKQQQKQNKQLNLIKYLSGLVGGFYKGVLEHNILVEDLQEIIELDTENVFKYLRILGVQYKEQEFMSAYNDLNGYFLQVNQIKNWIKLIQQFPMGENAKYFKNFYQQKFDYIVSSRLNKIKDSIMEKFSEQKTIIVSLWYFNSEQYTCTIFNRIMNDNIDLIKEGNNTFEDINNYWNKSVEDMNILICRMMVYGQDDFNTFTMLKEKLISKKNQIIRSFSLDLQTVQNYFRQFEQPYDKLEQEIKLISRYLKDVHSIVLFVNKQFMDDIMYVQNLEYTKNTVKTLMKIHDIYSQFCKGSNAQQTIQLYKEEEKKPKKEKKDKKKKKKRAMSLEDDNGGLGAILEQSSEEEEEEKQEQQQQVEIKERKRVVVEYEEGLKNIQEFDIYLKNLKGDSLLQQIAQNLQEKLGDIKSIFLQELNEEEFLFLQTLSESLDLIEFLQDYQGDLRAFLDSDDDRNNNTEIIFAIHDIINLELFIKDFIKMKESSFQTYLQQILKLIKNGIKNDNQIVAKMVNATQNLDKVKNQILQQFDKSLQTLAIIEGIVQGGSYEIREVDQQYCIFGYIFRKVNRQTNVTEFNFEDLVSIGSKALILITSKSYSYERNQENQYIDEKILQKNKNLHFNVKQYQIHIELLYQYTNQLNELIDNGFYSIDQSIQISCKDYDDKLQISEVLEGKIKQNKDQIEEWSVILNKNMQIYPVLTYLKPKLYKNLLESIEHFLNNKQTKLDYSNQLYILHNFIHSNKELQQQDIQQKVNKFQKENKIIYQKLQDFQDNSVYQNIQYLGLFLSVIYGTFINQDIQQQQQLQEEQELEIDIQQLRINNDADLFQFLLKNIQIINKNKQLQASQFLICDKNTNFIELQVFLNRFLYNKMNQEYYVLNLQSLSYKIQNAFIQELQDLKQRNLCQNCLFLVYQDIHNQIYPSLKDFKEFQFQVQFQNQQQQVVVQQNSLPNQLENRLQIVYSQQAGLGKSYEIQKNQITKQIPVYGEKTKKEIIQQLNFLNGIRDNYQNIAIHLDLYPCNLSLNLFLFELLFLQIINCNNEEFWSLPKNFKLYIEIANNENNTLYQNMRDVLQYVPQNCLNYLTLQGIYDRINIQQPYDSPLQITLRYLHGLNSTPNTYFQSTNVQQMTGLVQKEEGIQLLKKYFFTHMEEKNSVPNFYNLQIFVNFFYSLIQSLEDMTCPFSLSYLNEIRQLLHQKSLSIGNIRAQYIQEIYNFSRDSSFQAGSKNLQLDQQDCQNVNQQEKQLIQRAQQVRKFKDIRCDFICFRNDSFSIMYKEKQSIPPIIKELYSMAGHKDSLPHLDEQNSFLLIKWLYYLVNNHPHKLLAYEAKSFEENMQQIVEKQKILKKKDYQEKQGLLTSIELTGENYFKIALIFLRINANLPVLIMGETGIGKTSIIVLLSQMMDAKLMIKNVHAGIEVQEIIEFIGNCEQKLIEIGQESGKVVVFFDEINTNKNISGILKEILVDKRVNGKKLHKNLVPIAACNPYKSKEFYDTQMAGIDPYEVEGIKFHRKKDQSNLVYNVWPLPESIFSFLWNYDTLQPQDEKYYIKKMLQSQNAKNDNYFTGEELESIHNLVYKSQELTRKILYPWSVSLRDIKRVQIILFWFARQLELKEEYPLLLNTYTYQTNYSIKEKAIVLTLACCYLFRFQEESKRQQYIEMLEKEYVKNIDIEGIIQEEQNDIIQRINPPKGVARNKALKENVFIMYVCFMNNIPLFLTGRPGCSKTLAINIMLDNFKGKNSKDKFLQQLPSLYSKYYQGHLQSTSKKIEKIFQQAIQLKQRMKERNENAIVIIIMDEIGLAELSPDNPLKVLHALLEPQDIEEQVGFIGISNWMLDASKMARGVTITRMQLDEKDLVDTAESIYKDYEGQTSPLVKKYFRFIAQIYLEYSELLAQEDFRKDNQCIANYHGLRDFYFMIKYICRQFQCNEQFQDDKNKMQILIQGFQKNFGGNQNCQLQIQNLIKKYLLKGGLQEQFLNEEFEPSLLSQEQLIVENLKIQGIQTRHLLISCENIQNALQKLDYIIKKEISPQDEPKYFIGSNFPQDVSSQSAYKIVNDIIVCIERGITCVVLNLDDIYQAFYDLLNQNYVQQDIGGKYFCRISIGADNSRIEVHPNFKFILIQDIVQINRLDPPLLNRFEKQVLSLELKEDSQKYCDAIMEWVEKFDKLGYVFAFKDQIAIKSLVQKAELLKKEDQEIVEYAKETLIHLANFQGIYDLKQDYMFEDKYVDMYIQSKQHLSLLEYLKVRKQDLQDKEDKNIQTIIYTPSQISQVYQDSFRVQLKDQLQDIIDIKMIQSKQMLEDKLDSFYKQDKKDLLIILYDLSFQQNSKDRIILLLQALNASKKNAKDFYSGKNVVILCQINEKTLTLDKTSSFKGQGIYFDLYWEQIYIDTLIKDINKSVSIEDLIAKETLALILEEEGMMAKYFMDTNKIFQKFVNYHKYLDFTNQQNENFLQNRINQICEIVENEKNLPHFSVLLEEIKKMILKLNKKEQNNNNISVIEQVKKNGYLENFLTLEKACNQYISDYILDKFVEVIYTLDNMQAFDTFYYSENQDMIELWIKMFKSQYIQGLIFDSNEKISQVKVGKSQLTYPFSAFIYQKLTQKLDEYVLGIYQYQDYSQFTRKQQIEALENNYSQVQQELKSFLQLDGLPLQTNQVYFQQFEQDIIKIQTNVEEFSEEFYNYYQTYLKQIYNYTNAFQIYLLLHFFYDTIKLFFQNQKKILGQNQEIKPLGIQQQKLQLFQQDQQLQGDKNFFIQNIESFIFDSFINGLTDSLFPQKQNLTNQQIQQMQQELYDIDIKVENLHYFYISFSKNPQYKIYIQQQMVQNSYNKIIKLNYIMLFYKLVMKNDRISVLEFCAKNQYYQQLLQWFNQEEDQNEDQQDQNNNNIYGDQIFKLFSKYYEIFLKKTQNKQRLQNNWFDFLIDFLNLTLVEEDISNNQQLIEYIFNNCNSQFDSENYYQQKMFIIQAQIFKKMIDKIEILQYFAPIFIQDKEERKQIMEQMFGQELVNVAGQKGKKNPLANDANIKLVAKILKKIKNFNIESPLGSLMINTIYNNLIQQKHMVENLKGFYTQLIQFLSKQWTKNDNNFDVLIGVAVFKILTPLVIEYMCAYIQEDKILPHELKILQDLQAFYKNGKMQNMEHFYVYILREFYGTPKQEIQLKLAIILRDIQDDNVKDSPMEWIQKYNFGSIDEIPIQYNPWKKFLLQRKTKYVKHTDICRLYVQMLIDENQKNFTKMQQKLQENMKKPQNVNIVLLYLLTTYYIQNISNKKVPQLTNLQADIIIEDLVQDQAQTGMELDIIKCLMTNFNQQEFHQQNLFKLSFGQRWNNLTVNQIVFFTQFIAFSVQQDSQNYFRILVNCPQRVFNESNYIPFLYEDKLYPLLVDLIYQNGTVSRWICQICKEIILIGDCGGYNQKGNCPNCKNEVQANSKRMDHPALNSTRIDNYTPLTTQGSFEMAHDKIQENYKCRSLSSIQFRAGNIFTYASLILYYIFNDSRSLNEKTRIILGTNHTINDDQLLNYLLEHFQSNWRTLMKLLGPISEENLMFLLSEMITNMGSSKCVSVVKNPHVFDTTARRISFENDFCSNIVNPIINDKRKVLLEYSNFSKKNQKDNSKNSHYIQIIKENLDPQVKKDVSYIQQFKMNSLSVTKGFDFEDTIFILNTKAGDRDYISLKKILDQNIQKELLYLQEVVNDVVEFYQAIQQRYSGNIFYEEAEKITIGDFLDEKAQNKQIYQNFAKAWNTISSREQLRRGCDSLPIDPLNLYSRDYPIKKFFLVENYKNIQITQQFGAVLERLAFLQNEKLEQFYELLVKQNKSEYKQFLGDLNLQGKSKEKTLDQLQRDNILVPVDPYTDFQARKIMEESSIQGLGYQQGKKVYCDLDRIENQMVKQLLSGKTLISVEKTPKMRFKGSLSQLKDTTGIESKVPQDEIQAQQQELLEQWNMYLNYEQQKELYYLLISCLNITKKIGGNSQISIYQQLKSLKITQDNMYINEILKSLRLNNLAKAIELYEINLMSILVELCHPKYSMEDLPKVQKDHLLVFVKKYENIVEPMQQALGRFIIRYLSSNDTEYIGDILLYMLGYFNECWLEEDSCQFILNIFEPDFDNEDNMPEIDDCQEIANIKLYHAKEVYFILKEQLQERDQQFNLQLKQQQSSMSQQQQKNNLNNKNAKEDEKNSGKINKNMYNNNKNNNNVSKKDMIIQEQQVMSDDDLLEDDADNNFNYKNQSDEQVVDQLLNQNNDNIYINGIDEDGNEQVNMLLQKRYSNNNSNNEQQQKLHLANKQKYGQFISKNEKQRILLKQQYKKYS